MNIQEAIESPRFRVLENGGLALEAGMGAGTEEALRAMGHQVRQSPDLFFGGAQGIVIDYSRGVLEGGSDPRMDGCAMGW
jgi:gamma-glutamyltranspeptidase/glutathione hydrolase